MGTILTRRRKHGGMAYMAKIILKRDKKITHRETKTFETHKRANDWIRDREAELSYVAAVSGHRSWKSLQRYTHIRQKTDKYAGWPWLEAATTPMGNPRITAKGSLPRSLRSTLYAAASE